VLDKIKSLILADRVTPEVQVNIDKELFYLECNPADLKYMLSAYDFVKANGSKFSNPNNSALAYAIGITDSMPTTRITQTPTGLPDLDYDTDARDEIKEYLVAKYGRDNVSLLGTYNTLKTKGAIKDVVRHLKPDMSFDEINRITKKFDVVKRTDYKTELEYFNAALEADRELQEWFERNPDIKGPVLLLLGNAKSTGVHAGGIVVSKVDIKSVVPLSFERTEKIWVTQPEMADVEAAGLIKYDFLGLITLGDLNRCMKLTNLRHGTKYTLSNIPMDDPEMFAQFIKGNTVSVFQFSTPLATGILTKLKKIESVLDLALITSIGRPGPMNMGMDVSFIRRNNGSEPIEYEHPALEQILKETYGIVVYQEQVMQIVIEIGGLSSDESLTVMKAMSKKKLDKIVKFKEQFVNNAQKQHKMKKELAERIWQLMESFAEYGFNKSHALAYACVSYLCMWFKQKYPLEWIASVLQGADKDDFKTMYQYWSTYIQKPDINLSRSTYQISEQGKVVMPFSAVNGIGAKALENLTLTQPYASFEDFFSKIDKSKVNRTVIINLIFSGCIDSFKPAEMSENKWRKQLVRTYIELRHKQSKPAKLERERDEALLKEVDGLNRGHILMKEIGLLNFTAFDYHSYYKDKMTVIAKQHFGKEAARPVDSMGLPDGTEVVVGGAIETIDFVPIKTGKSKGKERAIIRLTNLGGSVEVIIFPSTLERDDRAANGGTLRKLAELTPIIIKGKVNIWNEKYSIVFQEGLILL
jgi:DNA polymerase-3 subunit alpha